MARRSSPDARERILRAAARLFGTYGVHAVGLQQVIDEAGCGKSLLYREFGSKDDLVVAHLRRYRENWADLIEAAGREAGGDPARQLVAIVRSVAERATAPGYTGCPVHKAYSEFPDKGHPVYLASVAHFEMTRTLLRGIAERAGAADPSALAARLMLIIDGLSMNATALGTPEAAVLAATSFAEDTVRTARAREAA
ncbi:MULTISPECIES: TetR/AcrR family transcriptional regulator [unclassified Streptomyces]|uniref:TetR/AcrR family transcriptional regulator n=1 Tax=unclassified Streptomyces TaxID=2593676 RepID=UPI0038116C9C